MDGLKFDGDALFLDRADINTDEIIPARYLTESTKEALKPHCLEDLALADFDPGKDIEGKSAIVARGNFGCGSSREHAPWALEGNGIRMVIAPSFARIFRQNMFNCGLMAVELPEATVDEIFRRFGKDQTSVEADLERNVLLFRSAEDELELPFSLSPFDRDLVVAGGWVAYANAKY